MAEAKKSEEMGPEDALPQPGGRPMVVAFVGIVVLLETAMFFFLVPNAEEVSALAEAQLIRSVRSGDVAAEERASKENEVREFKLGLFGETFSPIDTERSYRVEIDLYGLVRLKDFEMMEAEFSEKKGRLRHEIRKKIRNSELRELNENNLGLLERRILTTCNHLLEDDLLLGIGFSSYQLIEQ
jgi:hypothetical protein